MDLMFNSSVADHDNSRLQGIHGKYCWIFTQGISSRSGKQIGSTCIILKIEKNKLFGNIPFSSKCNCTYFPWSPGTGALCQQTRWTPSRTSPSRAISPSRRTQEYNGMHQEALQPSHPGSGGSISITDLFPHSLTPHFDSFSRYRHMSWQFYNMSSNVFVCTFNVGGWNCDWEWERQDENKDGGWRKQDGECCKAWK